MTSEMGSIATELGCLGDVRFPPVSAQIADITEVRFVPIADIWAAARWADRLIYLKTVSETRAQLTFGRQRYVQTIGR